MNVSRPFVAAPSSGALSLLALAGCEHAQSAPDGRQCATPIYAAPPIACRAPPISQRLDLPVGAVPAAVRGPPRPPGRRLDHRPDRREDLGNADQHQPDRQERQARPARSPRCPGSSPNSFNRASAAGSLGRLSSAGTGTTENTNDFSGTITAVVTAVLPNGHLADRRREADRRQPERRRAALLRPGRSAS